MNPLSIAFNRLLFTFLLIFPLTIFIKKYRKELIMISKRDLINMVSIGVILALHFALWITSLRFTSVASSVILVTAHPVIVAPIAYYLLNEKLSRINVFGIFVSIVGVFILVLGNYNLGSLTIDTIQGNILAMLGGVAAGLYILGGRKMRKRISTLSYASIVYGIATIVLFIICLSLNIPVVDISERDYFVILLMAIVSGIFGHTIYNWSLKYVKASVASVALLGEPVGSALLAYLLPWINQVPSKYTILGGAVVLLGIYLTARENLEHNV